MNRSTISKVSVLLALTLPVAAMAHPRDEVTREIGISVEEDGKVEIRVTLSYGPLVGYRELAASEGGASALRERLGFAVMRGVSLRVLGRNAPLAMRPLDFDLVHGERIRSARFLLSGRVPVSGGSFDLSVRLFPGVRGVSLVRMETIGFEIGDKRTNDDRAGVCSLSVTLQTAPGVRDVHLPLSAAPPPSASESQEMRTLLDAATGPLGILLSLGMAFWLGAVHAFAPGHGKTLVGAYLAGSGGKMMDAVVLGLATTATHTLSVFLLGLFALLLQDAFVPGSFDLWLQRGAGLLVAIVGGYMFLFRGHGRHHHHGHHHEDPPREGDRQDLAKGSGEEKPGASRRGTFGLVALGVSGGLVPCPAAIVVLLLAVSWHRVALGLVLLVAFSHGLASVLVGLGLLVLRAAPLLSAFDSSGRVARLLPRLSGAFVMMIGIGMVVFSLVS